MQTIGADSAIADETIRKYLDPKNAAMKLATNGLNRKSAESAVAW